MHSVSHHVINTPRHDITRYWFGAGVRKWTYTSLPWQVDTRNKLLQILTSFTYF